MTTLSPTFTFPALFLAASLAACGSSEESPDATENGLQSEADQGGSSAPSHQSIDGDGQFAERPNFVAPEGWVEREPSTTMRIKEFQVGDDEDLIVAIFEWRAGIGGVDPNVERWANEVGLDTPVNELDDTQRWEAQYGDYFVTVVHLVGTGGSEHGVGEESEEAAEDAKALLAAFIEVPGYSSVWNVKLSGSPDGVAAQKDNFEAFLDKL